MSLWSDGPPTTVRSRDTVEQGAICGALWQAMPCGLQVGGGAGCNVMRAYLMQMAVCHTDAVTVTLDEDVRTTEASSRGGGTPSPLDFHLS